MSVQSQVGPDMRRETARSALSHMVEVVNSTPFEREPFAHFVAQGLFPPALYAEMLELLPDQSVYKAFNRGKSASTVKRVTRQQRWSGDRSRFKLTNASIDRLEGRQRSLWLGVRDALGAPEFKEAVFARLREGLERRFGTEQNVAELPGYALPELFRERSGYEIKPHPDTPNKVVTMQIALPADGSQERLGTEFYRRSVSPRHLAREPRGFEMVKQPPFLPNVAYAFVVSDDSWHGRTTLKGDVGERNTILNIWFTDPSRGNADIVEQHYSA